MTETINFPPYASVPESVRHWATAIYVAGLSGYIIPFGNLIIPLFIWLLKKDDHPYLNTHGKDVINFQLTIILELVLMALIYFAVLGTLTALNMLPFLLVLIPLAYVFGLIAFVLVIANLILMIIGAIKVNQGKPYTLPMKISFIS